MKKFLVSWISIPRPQALRPIQDTKPFFLGTSFFQLKDAFRNIYKGSRQKKWKSKITQKKLWCLGYHMHDRRLLRAIQDHLRFLFNFTFAPKKRFTTKGRLQTQHRRGCVRFRKKIFLTRQHHCFLLLYGSIGFFKFWLYNIFLFRE